MFRSSPSLMSKHTWMPGCLGNPLLLHQRIGCGRELFGNESSSIGTAWHRWHFRNRWCRKRLAVTLLRNTAKPALCQIRLPLFPSASRFHPPLPSSLSFSLSPHPFLACSLFSSLSLVLRSRCNVILLCFQHVVLKIKTDKYCFCGVKQINIWIYIHIYQTVTTSETSVDDPFSRQNSRRPAVTPFFSRYSSCVFEGCTGLLVSA